MRNVTNGEALELLDIMSEMLCMIEDLNYFQPDGKALVKERYIIELERKIDSLKTNLG
jgi:hypothetical protein